MLRFRVHHAVCPHGCYTTQSSHPKQLQTILPWLTGPGKAAWLVGQGVFIASVAGQFDTRYGIYGQGFTREKRGD